MHHINHYKVPTCNKNDDNEKKQQQQQPILTNMNYKSTQTYLQGKEKKTYQQTLEKEIRTILRDI